MKADYINTFYKATKENLADGRIKLTGYRNNGQTLSITYKDMGFESDGIQLHRTDCIGRLRKQKTCYNGGRLAVKGGIGNTTISVDELIYQLDRMSKNMTVQHGEYNHFVRKTDRAEEFGVLAGDVCDPDQNKAHNALAGRIKKQYGLVCRIPSHAKVYDLLNDRRIDTAKFCCYVAMGRIQVVHDKLK